MKQNYDDRSVEEKVHELKLLAQHEMQGLKVPGVAVGLIVGDQEYNFAFGITSIENPLEVTPQTLFQIGSTTKTFTATLIMQLVEQGLLSLDDRVRKYLPDFKVQDEHAAANVTVRQLLNHTSGWVGDIFINTGEGDDALAKFVEKMADVPQQTPLGAIYTYNNASLNIAGRIIEVLTGKTYEDAVKDMLLDPLEMANSFFFLNDIVVRRFAVGHVLKGDTLTIARPYAGDRNANPCGGLVSDAIDQMKYARFSMGDGTTAAGKRLMNAESMRTLQASTFSAGGDGKIALGWHIHEIDGVKFVSHGGSTVGQQSDFWMAPAQKVAMTVLTNQDGGTVLHERLTKWVYKHFLGVVEQPPQPLKLSDQELAPYAGEYVMAPTNDIFAFTVEDGHMVMTHTIGDYSGIFDTPPDPYPPMRAAIFEPDRYILMDDPFKDAKGEFMRGPDGKVAWMRIGGRVLAKQ